MTTDRLSIRIDAALRRQLQRQTSLTGESESELVRRALAEYLAGRGPRITCYDLARRGGLIGVVKDAPADLSTNRDHFEDFGK